MKNASSSNESLNRDFNKPSRRAVRRGYSARRTTVAGMTAASLAIAGLTVPELTNGGLGNAAVAQAQNYASNRSVNTRLSHTSSNLWTATQTLVHGASPQTYSSFQVVLPSDIDKDKVFPETARYSVRLLDNANNNRVLKDFGTRTGYGSGRAKSERSLSIDLGGSVTLGHGQSLSIEYHGSDADNLPAVSGGGATKIETKTQAVPNPTVKAVVRKTDGGDVSRIGVKLCEASSFSDNCKIFSAPQSGITDSNGEFSFGNLTAGTKYRLEITQPNGYKSPNRNYQIFTPQLGSNPVFNFNLEPVAAPVGSITGTVSGLPSDATVTVSANGQSTSTGSDGRYTLSGLPAGTHRVTVSGVPDGYDTPVARDVAVTANGTATQDFTVTRTTGALTVGISGASSAVPVNVRVQGQGLDQTFPASSSVLRLTGAPTGDYTVTVTAPNGYAVDGQNGAKPVSVSANGGRVDFSVVRETGALSGQVDNVPSGSSVTVKLTGVDPINSNVTREIPNVSGAYSATGLPTGRYKVEVSGDVNGYSMPDARTVSVNVNTTTDKVNFSLLRVTAGLTVGLNGVSASVPVNVRVQGQGLDQTFPASSSVLRLTGAPTGDYTVTVTAPNGYAVDGQNGAKPVSVSANGGRVDFSVVRETGALSGQVDNVPSGSSVTVKLTGVDPINSNVTREIPNVSGAYSATGLPTGRYKVEVSGDVNGYSMPGARTVPVNANSSTDKVNFSLTRDKGAVSGQVTDPNGKGVQGVRITAGGKEATTDQNGRYSISGLDTGRYDVAADQNTVPNGYTVSGKVSAQVRTANSDAANFSLGVNNVTGKVTVINDGGAKLSGVTVLLDDGTQNGRTAKTGADGVAVFNELKPGKYQVKVNGTSEFSGAGSNLVLDIATGGTTEIRVGSLNKVTGNVSFDVGGGVEGAQVKITGPNNYSQTFTTNNDGSFDAGRLPKGDYSAQVVKGSTYAASKPVPFTVQAGKGTDPISLEVKINRGTVAVNVSGKAPESVMISGGPTNAGTRAIAKTADGKYEIGDLAPGSYSVTVNPAQGYSVAPVGPTKASFTLDAGATKNLDFKVTANDVRVAIEVINDAGVKVPGAKATLTAVGDKSKTYVFDADSDGNAIATAVTPGKYDYVITDPKGEHADFTGTLEAAEVTGSKIKAPMKTRNRVTGSVLDDLGRPVDATITITGDDIDPLNLKADKDGNFDAGRLQSGKYTARISGEGFAEKTEPFDVTAGKEEKLPVRVALHRGSAVAQVAGKAPESVTIVGGPQNIKPRELKAASDGRYELGDLLPGDYTIKVKPANGYSVAPVEKKISVRAGEPAVSVFTVTANAMPATVRVRNDADQSVANAQVSLEGTDFNGTTNEDGEIKFEGVTPGTYTVVVQPGAKHSGASGSVTVAEARGGNTTIKVGALDEVSGSVTNDLDEAVSGVDVTITGNGQTQTVTTSKSGAFNVKGLAAGKYTASVVETNDYSAAQAAFEVVAGQGTKPVAIRPELKRRPIEVAVSGPVGPVSVTLTGGRGAAAKNEQLKLENGKVVTDQLIPGEYTVAVDAPAGYSVDAPQKVQVAIDANTADPVKVSFIITANEGAFTGAIVDEQGEKIAGAKAELLTRDNKLVTALDVDEEGKISASGIKPGDYKVKIIPPAEYVPTEQDITLAPGGSLNLGPIRVIGKDGSITGRIADKNGNALEGASAELIAKDDSSQPVTVGKDGSIKVEKLRPGQYTLKVTPPAGYGKAQQQTLTVKPGTETKAELLVFTAENRKVTGRVIDARGNAVEGVTIHLLDANKGWVRDFHFDKASGNAELADVAPGKYWVRVNAPSGWNPVEDIELEVKAGKPASFGVVEMSAIATDATGSFEFEVRTDTGEPVEGAKVIIRNPKGEIVKETTSGADGKVSSGELPVGNYLAEVDVDGYGDPRPVRVEVGPKDREVLDPVVVKKTGKELAEKPVENPGTVSGWLVDDAGFPIEGAKVIIEGEGVNPNTGEKYQMVPPVRMDDDGYFITDPLKFEHIQDPDSFTYRVEFPKGWNPVVEIDGRKVDLSKPQPLPNAVSRDGAVKIAPTFVPAPRSEAEGRILDADGNPVSGVTVIIKDAREEYHTAVADEQGKYTVEDLVPGRAVVEIETLSGGRQIVPFDVVIRPGEKLVLPEIRLTAAKLSLQKRVWGRDADTKEDAMTMVADSEEGLLYSFIITNDGKENLTGITADTVKDPEFEARGVKIEMPKNWTAQSVLKPGDHVVFTGMMSKEQMPDDAFDFNNVATAYASTETGVTVASDPDSAYTRFMQLSAEKKVNARFATNPDSPVRMSADDALQFTYEVVNTGSTPMVNVSVSDRVYEGDQDDFNAKEPMAGVELEVVDEQTGAQVREVDAKIDTVDGAVTIAANKDVLRGAAERGLVVIAREPLKQKDGSIKMNEYKRIDVALVAGGHIQGDRVLANGAPRTIETKAHRGRELEVKAPEGFNGTLLPGQRVIFTADLPPLKPGTRHHNAAEARGELPPRPKRGKAIDGEPDFGEDPSSVLIITPRENIKGNAHIIVDAGAEAATDVQVVAYIDRNGNGRQDEGEGIEGLNLSLQRTDNSPVVPARTDENGNVLFENSPAGEYYIKMDNPGGLKLAKPRPGSANSIEPGSTLEGEVFEITGEEEFGLKSVALELVEGADAGAPTEVQQGSSACLAGSSAANPLLWLIPIAVLSATIGGAGVVFQDQINQAADEMNVDLGQLRASDAVAGTGGVLFALAAIGIGIYFAVCGPDAGSSNKSDSDGASGSSSREEADQ